MLIVMLISMIRYEYVEGFNNGYFCWVNSLV